MMHRCQHPTCARLIPAAGFCEHHRPAVFDTKQFYASAVWLNARAEKLARNPVCETPGCFALALDVHHLYPLASYPELRTTASNLQSLCHEHHAVLTQATARPPA
jgi:5-methylcytosine-specific restriction endonuclease McrA